VNRMVETNIQGVQVRLDDGRKGDRMERRTDSKTVIPPSYITTTRLPSVTSLMGQFWGINTDAQALTKQKAKNTLNIGRKVTRGLGAGGNPAVGKVRGGGPDITT